MPGEKLNGSLVGINGFRDSPKVKSIFIYPIKSCKGISVSKAPLSPTGFLWDRHWMVINSRGRACTQRTDPKLALVHVELPMEAFSLNWEPSKPSYLVVRAPGMDELKVSLAKPCLRSNGVTIWEWSGSALDEGDEAAKWFTSFLEKSTRLVRFNKELETRQVDPDYASGFNVQFSDLYPFHLISEASVDALNEKLKEPVNINRFRPNIVVSGCKSFAEDLWKQIKINKLTFQGVMLVIRCKIPTTNQDDGTRGSEPNETMTKFRSAEVLGLNNTTTKYKYKESAYMGQSLVCLDDNKGKFVSIGDIIEVEKVFPSYADVPV